MFATQIKGFILPRAVFAFLAAVIVASSLSLGAFAAESLERSAIEAHLSAHV